MIEGREKGGDDLPRSFEERAVRVSGGSDGLFSFSYLHAAMIQAAPSASTAVSEVPVYFAAFSPPLTTTTIAHTPPWQAASTTPPASLPPLARQSRGTAEKDFVPQ